MKANSRRIFFVSGTLPDGRMVGHYIPNPDFDHSKPETRITHCVKCRKELEVPDLPTSNCHYCSSCI
jgi:hypothetical protein